MDGLTQGHVTNVSEWRNSAWKPSRLAAKKSIDGQGAMDATISFQTDRLETAVASQVIPRLLGAHPSNRLTPLFDAISASDVMEFTALVAARDVTAARANIEARRSNGISLEAIFLCLLIPSARRLSDLWESDLCHYEEIAVGMLNLQQLLHDLSPAFSNEKPRRIFERRALLMSSPCERNMLGVFMVTEFYRCVASEFFYRDGWDVWPTPPISQKQLLAIMSSQWFDLIEVSATCEARVSQLATDIAQLKLASRNPHVGLIVSGPAFEDRPELVGMIGADGFGRNPREIMFHAESFIERRDRNS